jgi:SAM-dependent MidA family methyltransferase
VDPAVLTAAPPPPLTDAEAAQARRVAAALAGRNAASGGWIPFAAFMETALYAPGIGYYTAPRPLFGAEGDFVTAPELSPLFAATVANGLAGILEQSGGGDLVELGAGSGALAVTLMPELLRRGAPVERYRIVEPSPALAARQRARIRQAPALAGLEDRFEWLDEPPDEAWHGAAVANEVLDALPVDRFRVIAEGCESIGVVAARGGFAFEARPASPELAAAVETLQRTLPAPMPPGYVSEWRPGQRAWLEAATRSMRQGALLVFDYGLPRAQFYHPSRDGGTLCGFRRHRRVADPLADPGLQDLTAWVDFSALADAAALARLELRGFATQAHYLLDAGLEHVLARLSEGAGVASLAALRRDASTLLLPGEMGERFKAMALARGIRAPLPGFGFRDLSASL